MSFGAISGVQGVSGSGYMQGLEGTQGVKGTQPTDGSGFGTVMTGAVDNLQQLQSTSNELAIQAVTGDLNDVHTAMIASTRAQVTLELVAAVRNKGIDAFNEIMRMQA